MKRKRQRRTFKLLRPIIAAVESSAPNRSAERVAAQRLASRVALSEAARVVGAPESGWEKDPAGAPQPQGKFHWSVSHKRCFAAAVVSDISVGIDIERIVPRKSGMFAEVADADEWGIVGGRDWPTFYHVWTAKEAALKSLGLGIGHLRDCRVFGVDRSGAYSMYLGGDVIRVSHISHEGHVAAVTTGKLNAEWSILPSDGCSEVERSFN